MRDVHRSAGALVAQGWILMFLLLICIFFMEFANDLAANALSEEKREVMKAVVILAVMHALVPMLVCTVEALWFRWTIAVLTGCLTLVMMAHQLGHVAMGEEPFTLFKLLDIAHHALGIWVTVLAVRWAREVRRASMTAARQAASPDLAVPGVKP